MIEGASWRRWVFFYVPLTSFIVLLLVVIVQLLYIRRVETH